MTSSNFFKLEAADLKKSFLDLDSIQDLAALLDVRCSLVTYYAFILPDKIKYKKFTIPKKSGGQREINAPILPLKAIQNRLNFILQNIYTPKSYVHGFVKKRSILTNARNHVSKSFVGNIDLKDFFPSINFGRVRGVFIAAPFEFNNKVATALARIACFDNYLPQGAPTSPIISNLICVKLDSRLSQLARKYDCFYTRYADDLTFSTLSSVFPEAILKKEVVNGREDIVIGEELKNTVIDNGFKINKKKLRLKDKRQRQEVTGLTTNVFPNVNRKFIRQVWTMIHMWYKHGLASAEKEYFNRIDDKFRNPKHKRPSFKEILVGKIDFIGQIRGRQDRIYLNLCRTFRKLCPKKKFYVDYDDESLPLIITEGSTDRIHLKAALRTLYSKRLYRYLDVRFNEYTQSMGSGALSKLCKEMCKVQQPVKTIFIFDSDEEEYIVFANEGGRCGAPRYWGNNVFSFSLPIPPHRQKQSYISIEHYYKDDEIKRLDSNGCRLFFKNEFDWNTKEHLSENLKIKEDKKIKGTKLTSIIDHNIVSSSNDANMVLSKSLFAKNVLHKENNFHDFNFDEFTRIFDLINEILR
ncbi:MAG: reverse transcriptase domain-containing protein [Candidatus Kaelpia imicola]|nr:reverse transcriptase domain-containing protein [Candidatus Kaelpia imicola]